MLDWLRNKLGREKKVIITITIKLTPQYIPKPPVPCSHCGSTKDPKVLFHICDMMKDDKHIECSEACRPREVVGEFALVIAEERGMFINELDTVERCVDCDTIMELVMQNT